MRMLSKYALPAIAVVGFVFALYSAVSGGKQGPVSQHVAEPSQSPFKSYIAAAGIIESKSDNINIGASIPGIVTGIYVKWGDKVKTGDPLFKIDDRELTADLLVRRAGVEKAKAAVAEAEATLADVKNQLELAENVTDKRAISVDDLERRRNAMLIAKTRVESAHAQVLASEADLKATETNIGRLTVRAPVSGEILQINIRPGEYAPAGALQTPLLMLGNLDNMHVRVDIDENDAWRFRDNSSAIAFIRGNRDLKAKLAFVRVEPYVLPKKSLTGDSTERVDTRVLQAIYSFDRNELSAYVGQQMDVFIDAPPVTGKLPEPAKARGKS